MATLFVGPSKLLSNVKNVMCVPKWDMTIPEKAIFQKERKKKSCFTSSSTILMKIFKKIRETLISASKCQVGLRAGVGGGCATHPKFSFHSVLPAPASAPSLNSRLKNQVRMAECYLICPHYKYQINSFFFFTLLIFFFFPSSSFSREKHDKMK